MTALTDNKEVIEKNRRLLSLKVGASANIFKGAICKIKADGYMAPMAAEASAFMAGIAYEVGNNSNGADGDIECRVLREGVFQMVTAGASQADLGSDVFASDDQTVSTTQGANEIKVGKIVEVISATSVMVDIEV
jgi:predicted RecA/RadA family phage recombinase